MRPDTPDDDSDNLDLDSLRGKISRLVADIELCISTKGTHETKVMRGNDISIQCRELFLFLGNYESFFRRVVRRRQPACLSDDEQAIVRQISEYFQRLKLKWIEVFKNHKLENIYIEWDDSEESVTITSQDIQELTLFAFKDATNAVASSTNNHRGPNSSAFFQPASNAQPGSDPRERIVNVGALPELSSTEFSSTTELIPIAASSTESIVPRSTLAVVVAPAPPREISPVAVERNSNPCCVIC